MRLEGDLGAGKTSLVRAMLRRLGWTGAVKSPTFTLLETYEAGGLKVNHFDFYRFETPEEFEDAGFADLYAAGAVCASEWSSKAAPFVPAADLTVSLAVEGYALYRSKPIRILEMKFSAVGRRNGTAPSDCGRCRRSAPFARPVSDRMGRETRQRSHVACGGIYPRDH